ncbi:hypothetical protein J4474_04720 [Candidatus Pacearchaeota archaeon]|nr:hypothetical protein [Candidatus Pacearchaeota archaeon]
MKIYVKIKFGASIEKIETFGGGRFLVYMTCQKDDPNAMAFFTSIISRHIGSDPKNIKYLGKKTDGILEEHVFEI